MSPREYSGAGPEQEAPEPARKKYASHAERITDLRKLARENPIPQDDKWPMVMYMTGLVRRGGQLKELARAAQSAAERKRYAQEYQSTVKELKEMRESDEGPAVELAWWDYIGTRRKFFRFRELQKRVKELRLEKRQAEHAVVETAGAVEVGKVTADRGRSAKRKLAAVGRETLARPSDVELEDDVMRDLFGDAWEGEEAEPAEEQAPQARTAATIDAELAALKKEMGKLWNVPMVREFHRQSEEQSIRGQLQEGREVIEIPSTVAVLNTMARFEEENPAELFGSVLVGPPGTGKTTVVREYCRRTDRPLVEIDLSGDVTRYLFWGSRQLIHEDTLARADQIQLRLAELSGDGLVTFVQSGIEQYGPAFLGIAEQIGKEAMAVDEERAQEFQQQLQALIKKNYLRELSTEVYKYGRQNGWTAGLVMQALQDGHSVLFNEFNKAKDLSFLHGLLTARAAADDVAGTSPPDQEEPGWFRVAEAKQMVRLRTFQAEDGTARSKSKLYFTANVGTKYKVQSVLGPLASRAEGKTIEVGYVPKQEEAMILTTLVQDATGRPVLDDESNQKLLWLVGEVFPKIRKFIADRPTAVEISFRTIRNIARKLVDPETQAPREGASIDRAVKEVMVDIYTLYGEKDIPHQIVLDLITQKVFTDPKIITQCVTEGYITQEEVEAILNSSGKEEQEEEQQ